MNKNSLLCGAILLSPIFVLFAEPPLEEGLPSFEQYMPKETDGSYIVENDEEPDAGNWYEKLQWWKEAKRVYTVDIHDAMEQLKTVSEQYADRKKNVLDHIDKGLALLPISIEAAQPLIEKHLADLKTKRELFADAQTQEQRMALSEIDEDEKALQTVKEDFSHLATLVSQMREAFDVFAKQEKECENYEERALEYFERIEKTLDDKKAHHYYDIVENSLENIQSIIHYFIGPLNLFLDDALTRFDALIPKIKKGLADLEKRDIRIKFLTDKEKAEEAELEKKRQAMRLKAEAQKKAQEAWQKMAWYQKIFSLIGSFFGWLWSLVTGLFSAVAGIFSSKTSVLPVVKK